MTGILMLDSLTRGNTLKQGDKTPLKYKLLDADGDKLDIAGKPATVRLVYPNYLTIGYEKSGLTVASDDTVTFTIDKLIPARKYHVEIIVDNKYVFPSRSVESKFTIDKSSLGTESNIIEIVGKEALIRTVKSQVDTELQPLVTSLQAAQQAEAQRVSAEEQREIDHVNRSAELDGKADKVVIKNLIENGDFSDGGQGWVIGANITNITFGDNYVEFTGAGASMGSGSQWVSHPPSTLPDSGDIVYAHSLVTRISGEGNVLIGSGYSAGIGSAPLNGKTPVSYRGIPLFEPNVNNRNVVLSAYGGVTARFESVVYLNLTKIFGTSNEPTKEEMDRLIEITGYIDEEYALNNKEMFRYLMDGKANKQQEDWVTPTLLNGWMSHQSWSYVKYYKNTIDDVRLTGRVKSGTIYAVAFVLPVGYRPARSLYFTVESDIGTGICLIDASGSVWVRAGSDVSFSFDGITFRAEV